MTFQSILSLACWAWGLVEIVGSYIIPRLRQRSPVKAKSDRGSRMVIWLSVFVSIAIVNVIEAEGIVSLPESFLFFGIGLMVVGIAFRQWSILVLGRYFSTSVRILRDHRIVTTGPYSVIRHPAYTGSLITLVGLGLASRTWEGTLLITVGFGLAFYYRITVEEKALKTEFGQAYVDYANRTKRLIPFLL